MLSGMDGQFALDRDHAAAQADQAVEALRSAFLATPYRPTGLSTPARTVVRLVDELNWLNAVVVKASPHPGTGRGDQAALEFKTAAAAVLELGADLLDRMGGDPGPLTAGVSQLQAALAVM